MHNYSLKSNCNKDKKKQHYAKVCGDIGKSYDFDAHLSGFNEVPPVNSQASGKLYANYLPDGHTLSYVLTTDNLENVFAAHFHLGAPGVNGPVVKTLNFDFESGTAVGTWTPNDTEPISPTLVRQLFKGNIYVNVHTEQFPSGEIRGQVLQVEDCKEKY